MSSIQYPLSAYGLTQALINVFPQPIVSPSANPTTSNKAQIGTLWINKSANTAYILTSIVNNLANWQLLETGGGAGVFTSLVVNPGPTSLSTVGNGAVTIGNATNTGAVTIAAGTGGFSATANGNAISIGDTAAGSSLALAAGTGNMTLSTSATGTITEGSAAMTGTITLGLSTAGQIINIGNAANAGAQTINIASGASGANSAVNILNGVATAGAQTLNIMASGGRAGFVNIANGAIGNTVIIGSTTAAAATTLQGGTGGITLSAPFVALPGPVYLYTGAGAPSNGLALHVGDMYINTTAASTTTRLYIATGAGAWTYFTSNA